MNMEPPNSGSCSSNGTAEDPNCRLTRIQHLTVAMLERAQNDNLQPTSIDITPPQGLTDAETQVVWETLVQAIRERNALAEQVRVLTEQPHADDESLQDTHQNPSTKDNKSPCFLLGVPHEILLMICNRVFPHGNSRVTSWSKGYKTALKDLSHLGQTCKALNSFTAPLIYRFIQVDHLVGPDEFTTAPWGHHGVHLLRLLRTVAGNPSLGGLIRQIEFYKLEAQWDTFLATTNDETRAWLRSMIEQETGVILDWEPFYVRPRRWSEQPKIPETFLPSMMLHFTPNVKHINFNMNLNRVGDIRSHDNAAFERIYAAIRRPSPVELFTLAADLRTLKRIIEPSGLESIGFCHFLIGELPRDVELKRLKRIRVSQGHLNYRGISRLIDKTQCLEHFEYYRAINDYNASSVQFGNLMNCLVPHCDTLRTLAIKTRRPELGLMRHGRETWNKSPQLRSLTLSWDTFFSPSGGSTATFSRLFHLVPIKRIPRLESLSVMYQWGWELFLDKMLQDFADAVILNKGESLQKIDFRVESTETYPTPDKVFRKALGKDIKRLGERNIEVVVHLDTHSRSRWLWDDEVTVPIEANG